LTPGEIGAWAAAVLAGAATAWRLLAPVVRDFKGKGDDPSLRTLVELTAANSTLLVGQVGEVKGAVADVKSQADRVEAALEDLHERVERVEEFTGLKSKVKRG
jgi:hypothetical protein